MSNQITIKDINTLLNATQIAVKMFAISKDIEQDEEQEDEEDEDEEEEDEDEEEDDEDEDEDEDEEKDEEDEDDDLLRIQLYEMSVRLHELQQNYNNLLLELKMINNPEVDGVRAEKHDNYDDMPALISIEESKRMNEHEYKNTAGFLSIDSDFEQNAWLNVDNRPKIIEKSSCSLHHQ